MTPNLLIDRWLPESVYIGGLRYKINTDFRHSLLFTRLLEDPEIDNDTKALQMLNIYLEDQYILDPTEAAEQILWFYTCGKEPKNTKQRQRNNGPVFSFYYDAEYIFAAFYETYGIDLTEVDMHWWKFRALFSGLSDNTELRKIMGYRSIAIDSNMTDTQKKFYKEQKEIHALPDNRTQEEKEMDFAEALNG